MHYQLRLPIRITLIAFSVAVLFGTACMGQEWQAAGQGYAPMPQTTTMSNDFTRPVVPGPPVAPSENPRPASWPGQVAESSPWVPPDQRAAAPQAPIGELQPCDGTRIIARVGSEAIFEREAAGAVNEIMEVNKDRIPASQWDKQREMLIQQRLKGLIETKLIYLDARRTIPAEGWPQVEKQINKYFEENELEKMIDKSGVKNARELDAHLRELGTSLDAEKRAFIERALAQQWVQQQIKRDDEITYDQMVEYYRRNIKEFTTPARAEWEELMVRYSKHPGKQAAYDAIAQMGNQILAGVPFAETAQKGSDSHNAAKGGRWPWTSKNALASPELDEALFALPVGQLSPIIATEKGYHIIRVIRREDETIQPFLDAQVDIKKKIVEERSKKQFREYMAKLEQRTPVWTVFDSSDGTMQLANPQHSTLR